MNLEILISTYNEGIYNIKKILLPPIKNINYFISHQVNKKGGFQFKTEREEVKYRKVLAKGLSKNGNLCLSKASRDICLLADDDVSYSKKYLKKIIRRYKTNNLDIKKRMFFYNTFAQSAVMIRASVLEEVGYYDENYSVCEDYDLWFRVAEKYKIANINKPLVKYRISPTQSKMTRLKKTLRMTISIQKKWLFNENFFNALAVINLIFEYFLLLFPNKLILWFFRKVRY